MQSSCSEGICRHSCDATSGLASLSGRANADPTRPKKVASVEGITEYRLDNGLRVLLFPDPTPSQGHRQPDGPGRLAARGLRRDGHGPPSGAHGLQGNADPSRHPRCNEGTRGPVQRLDLTSIGRITSRPCPPPTRTSSSPSGSRPTAWSTARSRPRTSRPSFPWCATSSNRAKTHPSVCCRNGWRRSPTSGTTTASRRSATAPTSSACRSTTCGPSTRSFISPTTPCSSSPASSTRRKHLSISRNILAPCPGPTASSPTTYTEEPPQDGERSVTLRRVGDVGLGRSALSRSGRLACRVPRGGNPGEHPRVPSRRGGSTRLWSNRRWPRSVSVEALGHATTRARSRSSPSVNTKDPAALEKVRDVMLSVLDEVAQVGGHPGGSGSCPPEDPQES